MHNSISRYFWHGIQQFPIPIDSEERFHSMNKVPLLSALKGVMIFFKNAVYLSAEIS